MISKADDTCNILILLIELNTRVSKAYIPDAVSEF